MTAIIVWGTIAIVVSAFLGAAALLACAEWHAERVARLRRTWRQRG